MIYDVSQIRCFFGREVEVPEGGRMNFDDRWKSRKILRPDQPTKEGFHSRHTWQTTFLVARSHFRRGENCNDPLWSIQIKWQMEMHQSSKGKKLPALAVQAASHALIWIILCWSTMILQWQYCYNHNNTSSNYNNKNKNNNKYNSTNRYWIE